MSNLSLSTDFCSTSVHECTGAPTPTGTPTQAPVRIALSGDRPTGALHLGHYVGSLQGRLALMDQMPLYLLIADMQALTDHMGSFTDVASARFEVLLDYLAVGFDPAHCTIFTQSACTPLHALTMILLNLTHTGRLLRNPTVRREAALRSFTTQDPSAPDTSASMDPTGGAQHALDGTMPAGFFIYPVSQAADIVAFDATDIPVGDDQLPMIEQCNELVRSFNRLTDTATFTPCTALLSHAPRLSGIYGQHKMSKSLGNAIFLKDDPDTIRHKVFQMYTDPLKKTVADPGHLDAHVVFEFLDVFDTHPDEVHLLKEHYQRGGLGDVALKRRLTDVLVALLDPIRVRRVQLAKHPDYLHQVLCEGNAKAHQVASAKLHHVYQALGLA